jgi:hypothetical protein
LCSAIVVEPSILARRAVSAYSSIDN